MTWKRWLFTAASFAAVLGVSMYFVKSWVRAGGAVALPARAHLWAASAVVVEIVTRAFKLGWGARAVGVVFPFWTAVRASLAGDFGAAITPARSGSEPARFLVLVESGVSKGNTLVVLYVEVLIDMVSLAAVVAAAQWFFTGEDRLFAALWGMVFVYATVPLGLAAVAILLARRPHREEPPAWARLLGLTGTRWDRTARWFERLRQTVGRVRGAHPGWIAASFTSSVIHVAMRLVVLPAIVLGAGTSAPLAPLAVWPLALLYGAAMVPVPAGGGAIEITFRVALDTVIDPHYFFAALLWWRFYTFYLYIVIGGIAAGRTAMRALRARDEGRDGNLE